MPGRVCEFCGIVYPPGKEFLCCEVCGGETQYSALRIPTHFPKPEPTTDPEAFPFPLLNAPLEIRDGAIVIDSHELIRRGYLTKLLPGQVFRIEVAGFDGDFYIEIAAYSYNGRLYIVREFTTTFPDFVPEGWEKEAS